MALFFNLFAYADDIDIVGPTKRDVSTIERNSMNMRLAIYEGKTKYMSSSSGDIRPITILSI